MSDSTTNDKERFDYEDFSPEELEKLEDEEDIKIEEKKPLVRSSGSDYVRMYKELHRNPKRFPGFSISSYSGKIADLVDKHSATTLLDYGCGKGYQYLKRRVHDKWGGILPSCYDPGVPFLDTLPKEGLKFDGVLCIDVLEHIPRQDVKKFVEKVFSYADKFVFFTVAIFPADKELPNGENCHITIKPVRWWREIITKAAKDIPYELAVNTKREPTEC